MAERFNGTYEMVDMSEWDCQPNKMAVTKQHDHGLVKDVVYFMCPCGCNGAHCLPINGSKADNGAGWHFSQAYGMPTISPSIFANKTCQTHFFIINGMVQWC
jgi:hypothetical protein